MVSSLPVSAGTGVRSWGIALPSPAGSIRAETDFAAEPTVCVESRLQIGSEQSTSLWEVSSAFAFPFAPGLGRALKDASRRSLPFAFTRGNTFLPLLT